MWALAVKSAGPEDRHGRMVALDREERRRMGFLEETEASELHPTTTVDEEEALFVGE